MHFIEAKGETILKHITEKHLFEVCQSAPAFSRIKVNYDANNQPPKS